MYNIFSYIIYNIYIYKVNSKIRRQYIINILALINRLSTAALAHSSPSRFPRASEIFPPIVVFWYSIFNHRIFTNYFCCIMNYNRRCNIVNVLSYAHIILFSERILRFIFTLVRYWFFFLRNSKVKNWRWLMANI